MRWPKFIALLIVVILLGVLQNTNFLNVAGVKPNLLLVAVIAVSFFLEDAWLYVLLVIVAALFLKTRTGLEPELLVFVLLTLLAGWVGRLLRWLPAFNNLLLTGAGTAVFYLLVRPAYLIDNFGGLVIELIYNLIIGAILFKIFQECLKTSWTSKS